MQELSTAQQKINLRTQLRQARQTWLAQDPGRALEASLGLAEQAQSLLQIVASTRPSAPEGWSGKREAGADPKVLIISSYRATAQELDPSLLESTLNSAAKLQGQKLLWVWPKVTGQEIAFMAGNGQPDFVRSGYGLLEPGPGASEHEPSVMLIPLIGVDQQGYRLGQGGGFYDRALSKQATVRVGIAFDCQLVQALPREAHDQALHALVTPTGVKLFQPG